MVLFRYSALSESGRKLSGVIDADSLVSAKERLRKDQILVLNVEPLKHRKKGKAASLNFLLDFSRMLSQLLSSGIPLYDSLVILEERYQHHAMHPILIDLTDHLKVGCYFSEILEKYPSSFDPIYIAMVKAGEESGTLEKALKEICILLDKQYKLKKQISSAMTYPIFLGGFCLVVFISLLIFVIPSLKNLFEGKALHPLTQIIFKVSDFFISSGFIVLVCLIFLVLGICGVVRIKSVKLHLDKLFLYIPFIGNLIQQAAMVRFCRTCSLLLFSGVSLLQALHFSKKVIKNVFLEQVIEKIEQKISEGNLLSEELKSTWIPSLIPRMISISEKTGKMGEMFYSVANILEEALEKSLTQFTTLLQPILLLILGLIVGIVLLSILIPLTDVGSVLQM